MRALTSSRITLSRLMTSLGLCAALTHGVAQAQDLLHMIESARDYDAQWRAVLAEKEAVQRRSDQARAPLLPRVGVGAELAYSHTRLRPMQTRHSGSSGNLALQATQALYRPADRVQLAQSRLAEQEVAHKLDAAAQDLIVRVAQAYFDVLAAQETWRVVQAQKMAVQEQLAAAERNFEVGNATITDTREAQARFDLIRAQEIAAENDLQVKKLALDQATGLTHTQPWPLHEPVDLPTLEPAQVQPWVERAQAQQPQIRRAQLALDIARLETDKARTGHLPTVELSASVAHSRTPEGTVTLPQLRRSHQAQVGVAMNMPLFAGFAVENRIRETVALQEQAQAQLDGARRQAEQATREVFYGLQSGLSQVQALQAAQASSLSALEANRLGYEVGVRINIDVLNAQSQLYQTRRELAQARYAVLMGHLRLAQVSGTLDMAVVRRINALLAEPAP